MDKVVYGKKSVVKVEDYLQYTLDNIYKSSSKDLKLK